MKASESKTWAFLRAPFSAAPLWLERTPAFLLRRRTLSASSGELGREVAADTRTGSSNQIRVSKNYAFMHNLGMHNGIFEADVALAKSKMEVLGISQQWLSKKLKTSQSQVSRVLSGRTSASSKLARDLCFYVNQSVHFLDKSSIAANDDLMNALAETWDGTPAHARALAVVIRSLGMLHPQPTRGDGA